MITLFTTKNCPRCKEIKAVLENSNIDFIQRESDEEAGYSLLQSMCDDLELDMPRESPILICGETIYSGYDIITAVEEHELDLENKEDEE